MEKDLEHIMGMVVPSGVLTLIVSFKNAVMRQVSEYNKNSTATLVTPTFYSFTKRTYK